MYKFLTRKKQFHICRSTKALSETRHEVSIELRVYLTGGRSV